MELLTMDRVSVLCVLLLLFSLSLKSGAELQDEQTEVSPESVDVTRPSDLHTVLHEISTKLTENRLMIQQLQTLIQEQAVKLRELDTVKQQLQAQSSELESIKAWANVTENHVDSLRRHRAVEQVAFSASLMTSGSGFTGPYNVHTPLIFRHVFSNIGNAYNPDTGFFTAPVRGAYHFEFYVSTRSEAYHRSAAGLVKNGEHVVVAHERGPNGQSSAANGATLLLEPGDVVYVRLWEYTNIYDDEVHNTSFNGHLLFPM